MPLERMTGYDCEDAESVSRPYVEHLSASSKHPAGRRSGLLVKRGFDLILASCALVATLPVQMLVVAAIRFTMGPPVFYRQCRPGLQARPIVVLKFRTMLEKVAPDGQTRTREQRFTRVGRLIRRLSLDEIPQLLNVLKGEMSIVGPRPLLIEYLPAYTSEQLRRHEVRPGITGLAQVKGRQELSWEERFRLDVLYVDHWSLRLDARIILATVRAMLSGQAEVEASSTAYYFDPRSSSQEGDGEAGP